jgi:protein O-GlcNAc transferase
VLQAWTRIVLAVPGSRLLLKARGLHEDETAAALRGRFEAQGLPGQRLELRGASGHAEMLAEYADIDIALDSFPFCGGLTTLEALWMGVAVVTLRGHSVASRQSHAVLAGIGCAEGLSFDGVGAFVDGAVALAGDAPRLAALRGRLRPALAASALCRAADFTRDVERLYRRMWRAACAGQRLPAYTGVGA